MQTEWQSVYTLDVAVCSESTLFAQTCRLLRIYTVCPDLSSAQDLHCLPRPVVCSGSTLFARPVICSGYTLFAQTCRLLRIYTVCPDLSSAQDLHCLLRPVVCSGSTTVPRHSSAHDLHYLPKPVGPKSYDHYCN